MTRSINYTQHYSIMLIVIILSVIMLSVVFYLLLRCYCYIMQSVVMLSVVMQSVVMLSVVMLNVVAFAPGKTFLAQFKARTRRLHLGRFLRRALRAS